MIRSTKPGWRPPHRHQMVLGAWPEPDRLAWQVAIEDGDILDGGGKAAHWRAATRAGVVKAYGRWLTWLHVRDKLEAGSMPAARATPANIAAYAATLRLETASGSVFHYVNALAMALSVMAPDGDWQWLEKVVDRLRNARRPTDRKVGRVVPSRELFSLGLQLMAAAEAASPSGSPVAQATRYRGGLMIALLAVRPFRIRNFGSIEIGRHLLPSHDGFYLLFEAGETKTSRRLEADVPAVLVKKLRRYLEVYRPRLLMQAESTLREGDERRLWISRNGRPMPEQSIRDRIKELTAKRFGRSVYPHLFRDCAATSIAKDSASYTGTAMQILGHRSPVTAERHYIHAATQEANRTYQTQMQALRGRMKSRRVAVES